MPGKRSSFVSGVLGEYISIGTRLLTAIVRVPVAIAHFGVAHYGIWLIVSELASYARLSRFGSAASVITLLSQNPSEQERASILRRLIILIALISFTCLLGLTYLFIHHREVFAFLFKADRSEQELAIQVAFLVVAFTFVTVPITIFINAFAGVGNVFWKNIHMSVSSVGSLAALLVSVLCDGDLVFLAFATGMAGIADSLIAAIHFLWRNRAILRATDSAYVPRRGYRDILRLSITYFFVNLFDTVATQTDNIIIGSLLGPAWVTPYAVTHRFYKLTQRGIDALSNPLWPVFGALYADRDWKKIHRYYNTFCLLSLVAGGFFWIFGASFTEMVVSAWAGREAYAGLTIALLFGGLLYLKSFCFPNYTLVNGLAPTKAVVFILGLEGILKLVLALLLIQHLGIAGVALAALLAKACTATWFLPWYISRRTGNEVRLDTRKIALLSLLVVPLVGLAAVLQSSVSTLANATLGLAIVLLFSTAAMTRVMPGYLPAIWREMRQALRDVTAPR